VLQEAEEEEEDVVVECSAASCVEEVDASVRSSRVARHVVVRSSGSGAPAVAPPSSWRATASDMHAMPPWSRRGVSDVNTRTGRQTTHAGCTHGGCVGDEHGAV